MGLRIAMLMMLINVRPVGGLSEGPELREIIYQLDEASFLKRRQACNELIAAGEPALKEIVKAQRTGSAEKIARLKAVERAIVLPSLREPSRFSFHGTVTLLDLSRELEEQTGNTLPLGESIDNTAFTLRLRNSTFWETVLAVCTLTNNTIVARDSEFGWVLEEGPHDSRLFSTSGVGLVKIQSLFEFYDWQLVHLAIRQVPERALRGHLGFFFEPRLVVSEVFERALTTRAKCRTGFRLQPMKRGPHGFVSLINGGRKNRHISCDMMHPANRLVVIDQLEFSVLYRAYANHVDVTFSEEGNAHNVHGVDLKLSAVSLENEHLVYVLSHDAAHSLNFEVEGAVQLKREFDPLGESTVRAVVPLKGDAKSQPLIVRVANIEYSDLLRFKFEGLNLSTL